LCFRIPLLSVRNRAGNIRRYWTTATDITREIARTAAKRESAKPAADQYAHLVKEVMPAKDRLDAAVSAHKIVFFEKSKAEVKGEEVKVTSTATTSDVEALRATSKEFMELFNPMDVFALFFLPV
jgi:hypothetical protein